MEINVISGALYTQDGKKIADVKDSSIMLVDEPYKQRTMEVAENIGKTHSIDKSTVYRTLEKAYDDLAVLFFGIEGVKTIEVNRKPKKSGKKTMRNADTRNLANAKKTH